MDSVFTDETILGFGKYKYFRLKDIPKEYLLNIHKNGCHFPQLIQYIKDNLNEIEHRKYVPRPLVPFICDKITYPTEKEAKFHLKSIKSKDHDHKIPQRAYECDRCSGWHLTSKPFINAPKK